MIMRVWAEYLLVRFVALLTRVCSPAMVRRAGTAVGLAFYYLDRQHRRVAQTNLATAFPLKTDAERRTIARHRARTLRGALVPAGSTKTTGEPLEPGGTRKSRPPGPSAPPR